MPKTYVLDTSALLSNGKRALFAFDEHEVVLPLVVVKELEAKRADPMIGFVARGVLHALEDLRIRGGGNALSRGVKIDDGQGTLRIEVNHVDSSSLPVAMRNSSHDTRILAVANNLKKNGADVTLVTNDLPMRLLAEITLGLTAEPFRFAGTDQGEYTGILSTNVDTSVINDLFSNDEISADKIPGASSLGANGGMILRGGSSAVAIKKGNTVTPLRSDMTAYGARGKNAEQRIALAHLLNPQVPVVSLGGPAGTGKTLLALAAGLQQTMESRTYSRVVVFRPIMAVENQNLGYLPGTEEEKMGPWGAAVFDALEAFATPVTVEEVVKSKKLEVLPVTHIRGRTFHRTFIIIDEAQNLERATLLAVLSRLGEGSKAVFSWDASQRDNLHIGRHDGIVPIVDRLRDEPDFAHVTLSKTERSAVAEMATRVLDDLDL